VNGEHSTDPSWGVAPEGAPDHTIAGEVDRGEQILTEARREADRIITEARDSAAALLGEATKHRHDAEADAHRIRQEAGDEAHRTRTQADAERTRLLSEARTLAEADTARRLAEAEDAATLLRENAETDARRVRDEAELEAQRARETAELDRVHVLEEARAQAYYEATRIREEGARQARQSVLRVPSTITPIHSAEVTAREFPRAWRGLDAQTVSKWLVLVEQSYTLLEDELDRRRAELDELFDAFGQIRRRLTRAANLPEAGAEDELERARAAWSRALEVAGASVTGSRLGFDTLVVRTALLDTPLRRRLLGYSRDQVRRLLESSASQMARLENQLHLVHAENERLRSVFIEQLVETTGWDWEQRGDGEIRSLRRPDDQRDA
jgi:cell division septum initiation protein DivIVA